MKFNDLSGKRFGRLTVIERAENKGKHVAWLCICECGKRRIVIADHLRSGATQSCGCLHSELTSENNKKYNTTHGKADSRLYKIYSSMKQRCCGYNAKSYKHYGGRGITVCEEWRNSFEAFYEWAMANGYSDSLTLDRIDVNGNYEPSNCRWATMKEQNNNKRNNRNITYKGETHTLAQWIEILKSIDY